MKYITLLILILLISSCLSNTSEINKNVARQENSTIEQVPSVDNELILPKGSQILLKSHKSFELYNLTGYLLSSVEISECDKPSINDSLDYAINGIVKTDSTMEIELSFLSRCNSSFLYEVEFLEEEKLNVLYHGYQSLADCRCIYHAKYTLTNKDYLEGLNMKNVNLKYISVNNSSRLLINDFLK